MEQDCSAFKDVAMITKEASCLAIKGGDSRFCTLDEFVAYAKDHPGELSIGNSGIGSFNHLVAAALCDELGIEVNHVPLDANESTTALLGGQIDAMMNMALDVIQQVRGGEMTALVLIGGNGSEQLPGVKTMKQLGYNLDLTMWRGITVPAGTPQEVVDVLEDAFLQAAADPEFLSFCAENGVEVAPMGGDDFDALMASDDQLVADIMVKIGLKQ